MQNPAQRETEPGKQDLPGQIKNTPAEEAAVLRALHAGQGTEEAPQDLPQKTESQEALEKWVGLHTLKGDDFMLRENHTFSFGERAEREGKLAEYSLVRDGQEVKGVTVYGTEKFVIVTRPRDVEAAQLGTKNRKQERRLTMYIEETDGTVLTVADTAELAAIQRLIIKQNKLPTVSVVNVIDIRLGISIPKRDIDALNYFTPDFIGEELNFGGHELSNTAGTVPPFKRKITHEVKERIANLQGGNIHMNSPEGNVPTLLIALRNAENRLGGYFDFKQKLK